MLIPGTICFVKSSGFIIHCSYEKRTIITLKYVHICYNLYLHSGTSIQQRIILAAIAFTSSRCHSVTALIYTSKCYPVLLTISPVIERCTEPVECVPPDYIMFIHKLTIRHCIEMPALTNKSGHRVPPELQ